MNKIIESIIYALPLAAMLTIFIQVIIEHRLTRQRACDDRQATAAEKFRMVIFTQYKGIYPITRISSEDEINRKIWDSIAEIESAAIEFSYFLGVRQRRRFIKALEQYQAENHKIDWREQRAYLRFPSMHHMFKQAPKQLLFEHIENLLKYTDKIR